MTTGVSGPVHEYSLVVQKSDIDEYRHANNISYIRWMQETGFDHIAARGWSAEKLLALNLGIIARSHYVEYVKPAYEGDSLTVQTWIEDWSKVRSLRKYRFIRPVDSELIATAEARIHVRAVRCRNEPPLYTHAYASHKKYGSIEITYGSFTQFVPKNNTRSCRGG